MIKITQGYIRNPVTGKVHDIIVKSVSPNKFKDILIGGGIVLVGITYLTVTAFKNGVEKMDAAEFKTLCDLGLIKD